MSYYKTMEGFFKMHDFYQILEINKDASTQTIKKAFRDKALFEQTNNGGDAHKMAMLMIAYKILCNPKDRKSYDQEWEVFNTTHNTEVPFTPSGYLPAAGFAFSKSFKKLHKELITKYRLMPLDKNQSLSNLAAFHSDLYSRNGIVADDLFSYIRAKSNIETEFQDFELLTPKNAVEFFTRFLQGDYFGNNLKKLSKAFYQQIKILETEGQQTNSEFQLYCGIYEILSAAAEEQNPSGKIIFSLCKITEYAKQKTCQSKVFMAPLLQSKYFRSLFSQALYCYWLSPEKATDSSYTKAFDGQATTKSLIENLKSLLIYSRKNDKSNDQVVCLLLHVQLLFKLEKDLRKKLDTINANSYREKAFHLIDWLPSLMEFVNHAIIVNTLLQIGIILQRAAEVESDSIKRMADEKLATQIYILAVIISRHASLDVELYACLHTVKCLLTCHYIDKDILKALQHRAIILLDLFPFYQPPKSNVDFIKQKDESLVLMRRLLNTHIDQINDQKGLAVINPSYLLAFYQAYEMNLKSWYYKSHNPGSDKKLFQVLMQELTLNKQLSIEDLNYNLEAPLPFADLDEQSWICPKSSVLILAKEANFPMYKTIRIEINDKIGDIAFILDFCENNESGYNRPLSFFDLQNLSRCKLCSSTNTLDPLDPGVPYHLKYPYSLLQSMLITDNLLKILTKGQEVPLAASYESNYLNRIMSKLPDHLKKIISDFHANHQKESVTYFWVKPEAIKCAIGNCEKDTTSFTFGNIRIFVKQQKIKIDEQGRLEDEESKNEGWDCYVLTQDQKQELNDKIRIIENSALIIIKDSWELIFWENHKATYTFTLEDDKQDLIKLSQLKRDDQQKIETYGSESLSQIYQIVTKATNKTNMPNRYSPEFIFAQEFTKYYDEFATYLPEFGQVKELAKATLLVDFLANLRLNNQEKISFIKRLLKYKKFCSSESEKNSQVENHNFWKNVTQNCEKDCKKNINRFFEGLRINFAKDKIEEKVQIGLIGLRMQLGTLNFTSSSPEIVKLCREYYETIKMEYIAEHGFSNWILFTQTCDIRRELIEPRIPEFIEVLTAEKKAIDQKHLSVTFKDNLSELSDQEASKLANEFLEGYDLPLCKLLAYKYRKKIAEEIKETFPEQSIRTLDEALNNSVSAINKIINCEFEKAVKNYEKSLKTYLDGKEKLEQTFKNLGLKVSK